MTSDKRYIEESFPVKEVSVESAREKSIRHGHISTLHIWWARRPLAASRATIYAALVPPPKDNEDWQKQRNVIIELWKWEKSNNGPRIEKARDDILKANGGVPPKILDPFAGGGSIPLEALRLGCESYANDYNPVAVLIEKCTLEYPQKYGHRPQKDEKWGDLSGSTDNPLLADVKKWGQWVLKEVKKEIEQYYPPEPDGSIPIGYFWARTIPCQNPACGAEIPLMRQFWLAKRSNKYTSLFPYIENGEISFKIIETSSEEKMSENFEPSSGTMSRAVAVCPKCGSSVDANTTRQLFQEKKSGQRMVATVYHKSRETGKSYRISTKKDLEIYQKANEHLIEKVKILRQKWGIEPVPDEPLTRVPVSFGVINVWVYGMNKWGDLFNSRQNLALLSFAEKIREAHRKMLENGYDQNYADAITTYLAFILDRQVDYNSSLCVWAVSGEFIAHTFGRQAIPMVWDYFELCPWSYSTGDWNSALEWISRVNDHTTATSHEPSIITQLSATELTYNSNFFDAVITDPPYYDNVPYSYISDFFFVWLKRSIGDIYPDLFATLLTPKKNEIVAYSKSPDNNIDGKKLFEDSLKKSFQEAQRVLKPNGIAVIVYAHKSTEGWETLINSLLDSGLIMTGAWPINTEMKARLRANESAALASSIYIVARKMDRQPTGFYNNVKEELKTHLNKKLERLWHEGISGADFFIAAIGSAIEVFGKYEEVMDYEGNIVRADRLLVDVRKIATDYAVRQILHNGFVGEISDLARLYVLWRWNYGEVKVPFDEARKLSQSCGIDITQEWSHPGFVKKEKEFVRLIGPQERSLDDLEGSQELIDVLHQVLLLWEKSKRDHMVKVLQETGYGKSEAFYRVAQAISETLTNESKEKKLLDGFLAGRERLTEEVRRETTQTRLGV